MTETTETGTDDPKPPAVAAPPRPGPTIPLTAPWEKYVIYGACLAVLIACGIGLFAWMHGASSDYTKIANDLGQRDLSPEKYATSAVAMLSLRDAILLRSIVVFVSFFLFLIGCLFVLKGVEASYHVKAQWGANANATLATASPGLVLMTIAAALTAYSLHAHSGIDLDVGDDVASPTDTPAEASVAHESTPSKFPGIDED
jgi:hypothetical protein